MGLCRGAAQLEVLLGCQHGLPLHVYQAVSLSAKGRLEALEDEESEKEYIGCCRCQSANLHGAPSAGQSSSRQKLRQVCVKASGQDSPSDLQMLVQYLACKTLCNMVCLPSHGQGICCESQHDEYTAVEVGSDSVQRFRLQEHRLDRATDGILLIRRASCLRNRD